MFRQKKFCFGFFFFFFFKSLSKIANISVEEIKSLSKIKNIYVQKSSGVSFLQCAIKSMNFEQCSLKVEIYALSNILTFWWCTNYTYQYSRISKKKKKETGGKKIDRPTHLECVIDGQSNNFFFFFFFFLVPKLEHNLIQWGTCHYVYWGDFLSAQHLP